MASLDNESFVIFASHDSTKEIEVFNVATNQIYDHHEKFKWGNFSNIVSSTIVADGNVLKLQFNKFVTNEGSLSEIKDNMKI